MSIEYIRRHYGCNHKIGDTVQIRPGAGTLVDGRTGRLLRARGAYLTVKGETWKGDFHPADVLPLAAQRGTA